MSRAAAQNVTALEHLRELWLRTICSVVVLFIGGFIAYAFRLDIIDILQKPLQQQLYYSSPTGSFQFIMQLCTMFGMVLALPVMVYNVLQFVGPALPKQLTRKGSGVVVLASYLLAAAGVAFGYFCSLPLALHFFLHVGADKIQPLITANTYFSFVTSYLAIFAVVFQLPLIVMLVNRIKRIKPGSFNKYRKFVYVGAFGVAVLIPITPDPLSQVIIALPIVVLYEISLVMLRLVNRKYFLIQAAAAQEQSSAAPFLEAQDNEDDQSEPARPVAVSVAPSAHAASHPAPVKKRVVAMDMIAAHPASHRSVSVKQATATPIHHNQVVVSKPVPTPQQAHAEPAHRPGHAGRAAARPARPAIDGFVRPRQSAPGQLASNAARRAVVTQPVARSVEPYRFGCRGGLQRPISDFV